MKSVSLTVFLSNKDISLLNNREIGCCFRLFSYYKKVKTIPDDIKQIAKICWEESVDMERIWEDIKIFFSEIQEENSDKSPSFTSSRAKKLDVNFKVIERHKQLAIENEWPDPDLELEAFKDHHIAKGTTMFDWDKAFYTWLRNSKKFNQKTGVNNVARPNKNRADRMFDQLRTGLKGTTFE